MGTYLETFLVTVAVSAVLWFLAHLLQGVSLRLPQSTAESNETIRQAHETIDRLRDERDQLRLDKLSLDLRLQQCQNELAECNKEVDKLQEHNEALRLEMQSMNRAFIANQSGPSITNISGGETKIGGDLTGRDKTEEKK